MSKTIKLLLSFSIFVLIWGLFTVGVFAEENKTGIVTGESVNVREAPDTSSNVLTQLAQNTQVFILDSSNGWYKISCEKTTGWISGQFISVKSVVPGTISGNEVNLRKGPGTDTDVITTLDSGTSVSILGHSAGWYKIKTGGGTIGWVKNQFVSASGTTVSRGSSDELIPEITFAESGSIKQKIVNFAKKFLGVRYVWSGCSPNGFDCSGFTMYVYQNFGVNLDHLAATQATEGTKVSIGNLQAGDLVFFDTNGGHNYINHVGVYIGNGQFIHASSGSSAHKVIISELSEGFYSNAFMAARRFIS